MVSSEKSEPCWTLIAGIQPVIFKKTSGGNKLVLHNNEYMQRQCIV
jgi:hypothetical protein